MWVDVSWGGSSTSHTPIQRVSDAVPPLYVFRMVVIHGCVHARHCKMQLQASDTTDATRILWKEFHSSSVKAELVCTNAATEVSEDVCCIHQVREGKVSMITFIRAYWLWRKALVDAHITTQDISTHGEEAALEPATQVYLCEIFTNNIFHCKMFPRINMLAHSSICRPTFCVSTLLTGPFAADVCCDDRPPTTEDQFARRLCKLYSRNRTGQYIVPANFAVRVASVSFAVCDW